MKSHKLLQHLQASTCWRWVNTQTCMTFSTTSADGTEKCRTTMNRSRGVPTKIKDSTARWSCGYQMLVTILWCTLVLSPIIFHSGLLSQVDSGAFKFILLSLLGLPCAVTDRLYSLPNVAVGYLTFHLHCVHIFFPCFC
jgi:hypothetical protein